MEMLPALTNWDTTKLILHRAAKVVSAFRKAFSPQLPNALHLSLYIRDFGLTTGKLPFGEIELHLADGRVCTMVGERGHDISLGGANPAVLRAAMLAVLRDHGVSGDVPAIDDAAPFEIDAAQAADYLTALWRVTDALRELRADWLGSVTPLVVWPHGFDASQLWFPNGEPDESKQPHLAFGFSPGSAGLPRPYVYAYASPMPDTLPGTPLPTGTRWHDQGWSGVVIDYDTLRLRGPVESELANTLRKVFTILAERLGK